MTHITDYTAVGQQQLSLDELLATIAQEEAEAIRETTSAAAICGRCRYRKRPMCADSIQEDREMCPVVRSATKHFRGNSTD